MRIALALFATLTGCVAVAQAPDADFRSGGFTELHAAARSGDVQRIRDLVDAGAKVDVPSDFGTTPLHSAAISSQIEAIRALISLGANTEARDSMGRTPLFVTVEVNSKPRATLEALLEAGASAEARNKFGKTPLEACWTEEAREVLSRHLSEAGSR